MMEFDSNYSRRIIFRLVIAVLVLIVLIVLSRQFILDLYVYRQQTQAGIIIYTAILLIFLAGLISIVAGLRHYAREEGELARFIRAMEDEQFDLTVGISPRSIIHQRYAAIRRLSKQNAPINHGALSSMLLAEESKRLTFPRYVHNILILL
ncbi:MAG: hypothetical protein M3294_08985, partial [Pseudomonadota bacterium]|nr:hypothetical protein [Pseudomonadota bacterium]